LEGWVVGVPLPEISCVDMGRQIKEEVGDAAVLAASRPMTQSWRAHIGAGASDGVPFPHRHIGSLSWS